MVELPAGAEIGEEDIARGQAAVRAVLLQRYEQVWQTVAPHVDGTNAEAGVRVDPRMVEAGIRVLDRLAKLYRVDHPAVAGPESGAGAVERDRAAILAQLEAIEARAHGL